MGFVLVQSVDFWIFWNVAGSLHFFEVFGISDFYACSQLGFGSAAHVHSWALAQPLLV